MDFSRITDRAKSIFERRGGTEGLKQDAAELKDIATGEGSLSDKAKAAAEAIKDPGAAGNGGEASEPSAAPEPTASEPTASEPTSSEPSGSA